MTSDFQKAKYSYNKLNSIFIYFSIPGTFVSDDVSIKLSLLLLYHSQSNLVVQSCINYDKLAFKKKKEESQS